MLNTSSKIFTWLFTLFTRSKIFFVTIPVYHSTAKLDLVAADNETGPADNETCLFTNCES
jgi:hypothetical protein